MRVWTNTGLYFKGGPGGLLLDTGSGPSFLPLPAPVLEQVVAGNSEPGVTTLRLPDPGSRSHELPAREIDVEVCFVCKKCRAAFAGEAPLLTHQRMCYSGNLDNRGAFRIVQTGYACKLCDGECFKTLQDLKRHCDNENHPKLLGKINSMQPPPSESPLSHEMEDVVNQITLLAARAAQETDADQSRVLDSNSNTFCQGSEQKRRFLAPSDVSHPLTSAGH
ncbi:hypothetical protein QE152_g10288 [Popillia japonica]|uniref:C2H2-type domain-containing protein n=1 Tax=Popillia japonica TaxID=7064 RepID=A0AAW1LW01_POPJA